MCCLFAIRTCKGCWINFRERVAAWVYMQLSLRCYLFLHDTTFQSFCQGCGDKAIMLLTTFLSRGFKEKNPHSDACKAHYTKLMLTSTHNYYTCFPHSILSYIPRKEPQHVFIFRWRKTNQFGASLEKSNNKHVPFNSASFQWYRQLHCPPLHYVSFLGFALPKDLAVGDFCFNNYCIDMEASGSALNTSFV